MRLITAVIFSTIVACVGCRRSGVPRDFVFSAPTVEQRGTVGTSPWQYTPKGKGTETLFLRNEAILTNEDVLSVMDMKEANGDQLVAVLLTPTGREVFAQATEAMVGGRLAIVVNGTVVSAPSVWVRITNGSISLTGHSVASLRALASEK